MSEQKIEVVTATTVQSAVANAVTSTNTALDVVKNTAIRAVSAKEENFRLAVESRVYYLEDVFEPEERARILSGHYLKNKPDSSINHSVKIQQLLDSVPDGSVIRAYRNSVFTYSKNNGFRPDLFGQDGQTVSQRGASIIVDGQQPCLAIIDKKNLYIDFSGSTHIVEAMGQSWLYICSSGGFQSEGHYIRNTGRIVTRGYLERGYTGGKRGLYPPMDGWSEEKPWEATGYADKGYWLYGFNTADYAVDLSRFDNNSARVDQLQPRNDLDYSKESNRIFSLGGYRDSQGISRFPQDDGSTSTTWGKWLGMQMGSIGNAITITGDDGTTVRYFHVEGFHGDALCYGKLAGLDGTDVARGDVERAISLGLVAKNQSVLGGYCHGNYIGIIDVKRCAGIYVTGVNCEGSKTGHPDWSVQHTRDARGTTIDPGYGFHIGRSLPVSNIVVEDNNWGTCARKCMDAHCGSGFRYRGNTGIAGYYGVSMVIEEKLALHGVTEENDKTTHYYQDSVMDISDNTFICGINGIHIDNGSFGFNERITNHFRDPNNGRQLTWRPLWWLNGDFKIHSNKIYAPNCLIYRYGHSGFNIQNNRFTFALPFGEYYGMRQIRFRMNNAGTGYKVGDVLKWETDGGSPTARGAGVEVLSVGTNGEIKSIQELGGTDYYKIPKFTSAINKWTGQPSSGTGADFTLTIFLGSILMSLGEINGRGPSYGDIIAFNRFRCGPDGNPSYMMYLGGGHAATIMGNKFDVTPYYTVPLGGRLSAPFASPRAYRSGFVPQAIGQGGGVLSHSTFTDNRSFNQATGEVRLLDPIGQIRQTDGQTLSGRAPNSNRTNLLTIQRGTDLPPAKPIVAPAHNSREETISFNFAAGDETNRFLWDDSNTYPIEGYSSPALPVPEEWRYVNEETKTMETFSRHNANGRKTFGSPRALVPLKEGETRKSTIVLPFSWQEFPSFMRIVGSGEVDVHVTVVNPQAADSEKRFVVTRMNNATVFIDGKEAVFGTTEFPCQGNHVIAVCANFKGDWFGFGAQSGNGNNVTLTQFKPFTIYKYQEKDKEWLKAQSANPTQPNASPPSSSGAVSPPPPPPPTSSQPDGGESPHGSGGGTEGDTPSGGEGDTTAEGGGGATGSVPDGTSGSPSSPPAEAKPRTRTAVFRFAGNETRESTVNSEDGNATLKFVNHTNASIDLNRAQSGTDQTTGVHFLSTNVKEKSSAGLDIDVENLDFAAGNLTMVVPFRVVSFGTRPAAFLVSAGTSTAQVAPSVVINKIGDGSTFKITGTNGTKINGQVYAKDTPLNANTWYVMSITANANGADRVTLGSRSDGNGSLNVDIASGVAAYIGSDLSAANAQVDALKQALKIS